MPRRAIVTKREVLPDPKYKSRQVTQFINALMRKGKKSLAERILYQALDKIEDKMKQDPLKVFKKGMENVKPVLEVKSRRVGGSTYQVPVEVKPDRRETLANRWVINFAHKRPEKTMSERLASEIMDAYNSRGASIKKKEDTHKMAEANKAFAHYRW
ncbi:30S ribosomal protein S7 [candidate division CSSED10-310 bacterium]|uniref:Small ribosomal subunit protein uS7 n=1 Tax=candidate division CSSED10-310 bacterium TaxID=2855610 RepID=A0ABV6YWZ9_UNCC1